MLSPGDCVTAILNSQDIENLKSAYAMFFNEVWFFVYVHGLNVKGLFECGRAAI